VSVNKLRAYEEMEFDLHLFLNLAVVDEWSVSLDAIVYGTRGGAQRLSLHFF
jgi:hypothetical protein